MALLACSSLQAQSPNYQFQTAPYDSSYVDFLAGDSVSVNDVSEVLRMTRPGKEDVDFIFMAGSFYLIFDLGGADEAYVFSYFDDVSDYQAECGLNGLSLAKISPNSIVGAVLRYYQNN